MTEPTDALEMSELKPCPFCQSKEVSCKENDFAGLCERWVTCRDCLADGPMCDTVEIAVAAWDNRPATVNAKSAEQSMRERAALERIADDLICQHKEPWPGSESDRLHFWRDKAIKAANAIHKHLEQIS